MKNSKYNRGLPAQAGFIKEIVILLIALVALKYFVDIDVIGYLEEGPVTKGLDWVKVHLWEKYIHE